MQDERSRNPANSSKNAERMLLASYVAGLVGVVGRQVRYLNPQSIQQAVNLNY